MEIPRLRILRHWSVSEPISRGYWLFLLEPRWPLLRFEKQEFGHELPFPPRDDHSLDVIVEYFDRDKQYGDCKEQIWAIDLVKFPYRVAHAIFTSSSGWDL